MPPLASSLGVSPLIRCRPPSLRSRAVPGASAAYRGAPSSSSAPRSSRAADGQGAVRHTRTQAGRERSPTTAAPLPSRIAAGSSPRPALPPAGSTPPASQAAAAAALAFGPLAPAVLLLLFASGAAEAATGAEPATAGGLAGAAVAAVSASGWAGPAVFVVLYVAATVLLFPASVLTLAAGALFGPLAGTALVSLASTTGAAAAFLVSRYLARPWVEKKVAELPRFRAVLAGVAANGPWVVFLLRLSPLVPFNLLNYALGLTSVPLLPYVGASWAGMLPGTFAYVYLGGAGRAAVDAAAGGGSSLDTTQLVLYGGGAVATILATRLISDAATKALDQQQPEP